MGFSNIARKRQLCDFTIKKTAILTRLLLKSRVLFLFFQKNGNYFKKQFYLFAKI